MCQEAAFWSIKDFSYLCRVHVRWFSTPVFHKQQNSGCPKFQEYRKRPLSPTKRHKKNETVLISIACSTHNRAACQVFLDDPEKCLFFRIRKKITMSNITYFIILVPFVRNKPGYFLQKLPFVNQQT